MLPLNTADPVAVSRETAPNPAVAGAIVTFSVSLAFCEGRAPAVTATMMWGPVADSGRR
jgi:hypothetical protein